MYNSQHWSFCLEPGSDMFVNHCLVSCKKPVPVTGQPQKLEGKYLTLKFCLWAEGPSLRSLAGPGSSVTRVSVSDFLNGRLEEPNQISRCLRSWCNYGQSVSGFHLPAALASTRNWALGSFADCEKSEMRGRECLVFGVKFGKYFFFSLSMYLFWFTWKIFIDVFENLNWLIWFTCHNYQSVHAYVDRYLQNI